MLIFYDRKFVNISRRKKELCNFGDALTEILKRHLRTAIDKKAWIIFRPEHHIAAILDLNQKTIAAYFKRTHPNLENEMHQLIKDKVAAIKKELDKKTRIIFYN